jgi:hypothetical protein
VEIKPEAGVRIAAAAVWIILCAGLGIFGGFAGEYVLGLPLTILIPFLPVRMARFQGLGPVALIAYACGVLLAVAWSLTGSFFENLKPDWPPPSGTIVLSVFLVLLSGLMVYAAITRPEVRDRLP